MSYNNLYKVFTKSSDTLDFEAIEDVYPNATSADHTNIAVNTSTILALTTVNFPAGSNQAIEINYIGPPL